MAVKPKFVGDPCCEVCEAAADKIRIGAICFHRRNKLRAAGHIGDACLIDFVDDLYRQTLEQPGALFQGLLEVQFAIHRSCGDLRHLITNAGFHGELVNAFLLNHGAIHIGQQHFLASPRAGLHHQINSQLLHLLPHLPERIGLLQAFKLHGLAWCQPSEVPAAPGVAQRLRQCVGDGRLAWLAQ